MAAINLAGPLVGYSVSLSRRGQFLAAGDCGADATWLYSKASGQWKRKPFPYVRVSSPSPSCQNGTTFQTVALSGGGTRLVTGIDGARHVAYIYDRPSNGWHSSTTPSAILTIPVSRYKSDGPSITPQFSISDSGATIIAGGVLLERVLIYRNVLAVTARRSVSRGSEPGKPQARTAVSQVPSVRCL